MKTPSLKEIDEIRSKGFRPGVVGCFIFNSKLLLLFKTEYKIWLLPQGGIANNEDPEDSLRREATEELGEEFVKSWTRDKTQIILEDRIEFREDKQDSRELLTDTGELRKMLGKHYYYFVVKVKKGDIDIKKTEFDDYVWADYKQISFLAKRVYQKNKGKALQTAASLLLKEGLMS